MVAGKGKLVLLKTWLPGGNTSNNLQANAVFSARTTGLSVSAEAVDITDKSQNGWRILGGDMGLKQVSISCEGVFTNSNVENVLRGHSMDANIFSAIVTFDNGDTFKGGWYIPSYERSGTYNGEEVYSLTLESANTIVFSNP